ncbi:RICIN domain-containing protein [Streptomyces tubbatahanensis]|uniref:RICIN domain-containing protein n=1 Tax=Streptomyces tubbatahanensis TaxID=2923272 RepID=A0ABY3XY47_9ACTN|nr:RICIN domain-containing protein [Streptomyces tubbatahanensis]UNS99454.1 RICIN domain-containing protein [Streptomyces tubbatahanensis]
MSEDGEARASGAPPEQPAPFEVVIDGAGAASIDGEQVPVIGDQPLDTAILDTLHGYARLRNTPVTAVIANPATDSTVHVEVDPDGSSRLAGPQPGDAGGAGARADAVAGGTDAVDGGADAVAGGAALAADSAAGRAPGTGPVADGTHPVPGDGTPDLGGGAGAEDETATAVIPAVEADRSPAAPEPAAGPAAAGPGAPVNPQAAEGSGTVAGPDPVPGGGSFAAPDVAAAAGTAAAGAGAGPVAGDGPVVCNGPVAGDGPVVGNGPVAGEGQVAGNGPASGAGSAAGAGPVAVGEGTPAVAGGTPVGGGQPGPPPQEGPAKRRTALPSIPRPSLPSLPRPALLGRASGAGGGNNGIGGGMTARGPRGSDVEFVPTSLLKKPWVVAASAVAVVALVTTPLALAGASSGEEEGGKGEKTLADGPKDEVTRGPGGAVRPSPPPSPSGSPSASGKDDPSDKPKLGDSKPSKPKDDEEDSDSSDEESSGGDDKKDTKKASGGSGIPSGVTMVVNRKTDMCLDLPGTGKGKPDGRVQQGACDTTHAALGGNQRWELDLKKKDGGPGKADLYLIRNVKDDLCLDLAGFGPKAARSPVTEYHCRAKNDNQLWWFDKRSNGTYWIRNHESGHLCLDVAGEGEKPHSPLLIFGCDDADDHQWSFRKP